MVPVSQVRAVAAIPVGVPMIRVNKGAAASRVEAITQVQSAQVSLAGPDRHHGAGAHPRSRRRDACRRPDRAGSASSTGLGIVVRSVRVRLLECPLDGRTIPPGTLRGSPSVAAAVAVLHEVPAPIARSVASASTASSPENVTLKLSDGVTIVWEHSPRVGQGRLSCRL